MSSQRLPAFGRTKHALVPVVVALVLEALVACGAGSQPDASAGPAAADAAVSNVSCDTSSDCAHPITGIPPSGPDLLYAAPAIAPQLANNDARFHAPFNPVSGTERYVDGEYSYTDYIYDDEQGYPADAKYAGNAADLAEFRIAVTPDGLAVRFTLNTLIEPDTTIAVVAFDSDHNVMTGSSTLPRDPGMPFPGTDQVLTTWGTGAEWSVWTGSEWKTTPLQAKADLVANQITVTVPDTVAYPSGKWRATLATGLYDSSTGGWLAAASGPNIFNLGFRFSENPGTPNSTHTQQDQALSNKVPTQFAHDIDFNLLRSHGSWNNIPSHGFMSRIYASRFNTGEGYSSTSTVLQRLSPLVPYGVYVPSTYIPSSPTQMTIMLHGLTEDYYTYNGVTSSDNLTNGKSVSELYGEERGSLILFSGGRSTGGFYQDILEADIFEAWNDMARHYNLDPLRTSIMGYSMGGHGTFRLGLLYPQLFARAAPMAAPPGVGIWIPGTTASGGDSTLTNRWIENARNLPVFEVADVLSELVPYPGQLQQMIGPTLLGEESFEGFQYRYNFWSVTIDHTLLCCDFPEVRDFLGSNTIPQYPFHVTYARMPSDDFLDVGMIHNKAYWLSSIEVSDSTASDAKGVVDAVSFGFGLKDPASTLSHSLGLTAAGFPYVAQDRTWADPSAIEKENRLDLVLTNIGNLVVHAVDAKLDLAKPLQVNVTSTTKTTITIVGSSGSEVLNAAPGQNTYVLPPGGNPQALSREMTSEAHAESLALGASATSLAGHTMTEQDQSCQYSNGDKGAVSNDAYYHQFLSSTTDQITNQTVGGIETVGVDSVQGINTPTVQFRDVYFTDGSGTSYTGYVLTFTGSSSGTFQKTVFYADNNAANETCMGTFTFK